ncbi:mechanosensitive ion channel family protein [Tateyamaria sp. ANG-S1]|uniref:mechanosensitive ion channel family protein n=1 Tax=Tateyamaria sp. ANG-S1 TaxID=1577905 RepID=UPI00057FE1A6|nr:mechanosensitive ion channel family protein [Tateyamaria sp. ANG-S1]KIC48233.1 mechanosensitive ion channel protein MscS [Tateyamaria sp. ANG-S1]
MRHFYLRALAHLLLILALTVPSMTMAQGLGSLLPGAASSESQTSDLNDAIETAAQNGVSVIVIDSDGRVVGQNAPSPAPNAAPGGGSTLMTMQDDAVAFRAVLVERLLNLPVAFNEVVFILRATSPDGTIFAYVKALLISMALFAAGMVFESQVFGKRIAKQFVVARIADKPNGYVEKMPFLVFRFLMGVVGTLVSMAVAYILGVLIFGPLEDTAMQFTVTLINIGYFLARVVAGLWRMILSPYLPQYRIPMFDDSDARKLHLWLSAVTAFGFFAILFGVWIEELGLNNEVYVFLFSLLSLLVMFLNIALIAANGSAITGAILNGKAPAEATWVLRTLAKVWAPLAIIYFLFAWGDQTYHLVIGDPLGVPLLAAAWGILTTILVVYGVINFFIERSFARARQVREHNIVAEVAPLSAPDAPAVVASPRLTTFEGLAQRVAGILAFVAGIYAFVTIWSPDTGMMGDSWSDRFLDIIVILFLGYIAYNAFRIWIDGKIREEQGDVQEAELGDEGGGSSATRLATLLPLFRNVVLIVIVLSILLIGLMEMGVNVGPLFAGAGIVGVAIGFGSQSLVRDIFSGAFFLFDDAFRKGEYIDVGGVKGTVENISVRSFQLRHHLGALHTIPFGEIQVLTNYSRDWVIMKLPLRVTYDTDVEQVRKLIKKLGVALLDDPVIGDNFIQPLKSQGVIEMQDSAMIIRVKFMTKPGDQWLVRKKVYEEIRALFEREGIKFAHREVTVRLADGKAAEDLTDEDRKAVTAAAQASIEEELLEEATEFGDDR